MESAVPRVALKSWGGGLPGPREIKQYLQVISYKTWARVKQEHHRHYLGCVWWVLDPLIHTFLYSAVLVFILHRRTENYTVFLLVGMTAYRFFNEAVRQAADGVQRNKDLLEQVYLPKWICVIVPALSEAWKFLFSFAVLIAFVLYEGYAVTWAWLALPFLFLMLVAMIQAVAMPLAVLQVYVPDSRTVIATLLSIGMWLSCVFYSLKDVPSGMAHWALANPIAMLIESFRAVLLGGHLPPAHYLVAPLVFTCAGLAAGLFVLRSTDRHIVKYL